MAPTEPTAHPANGNQLPPGTRMGEFEIVGLIGEGGFGIVYEAIDHQLQRRVAIKEYMPSAMASRSHGTAVSVKSERHAETFEAGRRSFVNEARLLAQFDHPSLLKVFRFWEDNGTAYMAMPLYRAPTLRTALAALGGPPGEAWLRKLLRPLLDAIETLHEASCYHRDIAPDNILILPGERPVLLDFGAARRVIGDMTQTLDVILKPGYAPFEQYASDPGMKQGPWTDVYALAAVVYYCITGKAPPPSIARLMRDTMVPAVQAGAGHYSPQFLSAIDRALAVRMEDRTASIAQFRRELGIEPDEVESRSIEPTVRIHSPAGESTVVLARSQGSRDSRGETGTGEAPSPAAPVPPAGRPSASRAPLLVGAVALLVAVAAGVYGWMTMGGDGRGEPGVAGPGTTVSAPPEEATSAGPHRVPETAHAPPPAEEPAATSSATPAPDIAAAPEQAPASAPGVDSDAAVAPLVERSPPVADTPTPVPPARPPYESTAVPEARPFSTALALEELYRARDQAWGVDVRTDRQSLRIDEDEFGFRVRSTRTGYLYLLMLGTDSSHFYLLFPNALDSDNRLQANAELHLPRPGWSIVAGGPPGTNRLLALVSPSRRDFGPLGLGKPDPFGEFDLRAVERAYAQGGATALAGEPEDCRDPTAPCARFGAASFEIRETD